MHARLIPHSPYQCGLGQDHPADLVGRQSEVEKGPQQRTQHLLGVIHPTVAQHVVVRTLQHVLGPMAVRKGSTRTDEVNYVTGNIDNACKQLASASVLDIPSTSTSICAAAAASSDSSRRGARKGGGSGGGDADDVKDSSRDGGRGVRGPVPARAGPWLLVERLRGRRGRASRKRAREASLEMDTRRRRAARRGEAAAVRCARRTSHAPRHPAPRAPRVLASVAAVVDALHRGRTNCSSTRRGVLRRGRCRAPGGLGHARNPARALARAARPFGSLPCPIASSCSREVTPRRSARPGMATGRRAGRHVGWAHTEAHTGPGGGPRHVPGPIACKNGLFVREHKTERNRDCFAVNEGRCRLSHCRSPHGARLSAQRSVRARYWTVKQVLQVSGSKKALDTKTDSAD